MKLHFLSPYPNSSITEKFDDIEINNFTIITGKNGVGKTHLLEAIIKNHIKIDNGLSSIYFNYNDFIVKNNTDNQSKKPLQKNIDYNLENQKLQKIKTEIEDKIFAPFYKMQNKFTPEEPEFSDIEHTLSKLKGNLFNKVNFLKNISWKDVSNILSPFSKELKNEIMKIIEDLQNSTDENFLKYYNLANKINQSWQIFHLHEVEESYLGQLLDLEFKNYIKLYNKTENDLKKSSPKETTTLDDIEKQVISKIGNAPWKILNDILKEYSCNGYIIDENLVHTVESFKDINQQPLNITLKNTITNNIITLDRLSSGEKTLFALAVTLYRQKQDGNLPELLLLDEIDSSLHPSMCKQLLNVLQNVFVKKYELKIIMVTHSPSTVALAPDESVYIMENDMGKISLKNQTKQKAINFLSEGYATFEEGLSFLDNLINNDKKISILTEGKNTSYIEKAIELIEPRLLEDVEIISGFENKSGKNQLKTLFDFISKIPHQQDIFFIWDCDCNEYRNLSEQNNTIPYVFDKNEDNKIAKKGIENLFNESLFDGFYTEIKKSDGTINKNFEEDRKNEFFKSIEQRNNENDFKNFVPLFEKIKKIIDI